ncbi:hypothetical protein ACFQGT_17245 [Natrialbaceae archaeon GCM10025810]|uniref:DUF7576 family protein n=1 Tax=Halovalidus salilacus TaxID=3075124 RepID=UPI0036151799
MSESTADDGPTCEFCGASLEGTDNRRVVPAVEDGQAVHLEFCGDDCLEQWKE